MIDDLFELDYDESLVFLKTFGRSLEADLEKFFLLAMNFKISKQMCKDLEAFFFKRLNDPTIESELEFDHESLKFVEKPVKQESNDDGEVVEEIDEKDIIERHASKSFT